MGMQYTSSSSSSATSQRRDEEDPVDTVVVSSSSSTSTMMKPPSSDTVVMMNIETTTTHYYDRMIKSMDTENSKENNNDDDDSTDELPDVEEAFLLQQQQQQQNHHPYYQYYYSDEYMSSKPPPPFILPESSFSNTSRITSSSSPTSIITSKSSSTVSNHSKNTSTSSPPYIPNQTNDNDDDKNTTTPSPPSSEYVLNVAFYSFIGFMILQGFVAYFIAHSSAMMADCEAMSIDALTYLFNLMAEQQKNHPSLSSSSFNEHSNIDHHRHRQVTLIKLYYEFIPPTLSVMTLMAVTIYTIQTSIVTIQNTTYMTTTGTTTTDNNNEDVSIPIMLLFSFLNLLLDILNVTCFARSGFIITTTTTTTATTSSATNPIITIKPLTIWTTQPCCTTSVPIINETSPLLLVSSSSSVRSTPELDSVILVQLEDQTNSHATTTNQSGVNLNMCSAWTHVCADTMRSMAVLLAAGIAMCIPTSNHIEEQYYAVLADSIAALVVSFIILLSIVPLLQGIYHTGQQIIQLHWENHHHHSASKELSSTTPQSYQTITV